jgi:hypothetical protein
VCGGACCDRDGSAEHVDLIKEMEHGGGA